MSVVRAQIGRVRLLPAFRWFGSFQVGLVLSGFDLLDVFCCNVHHNVAICYSCHLDLTILVRVRQWADRHGVWA